MRKWKAIGALHRPHILVQAVAIILAEAVRRDNQ